MTPADRSKRAMRRALGVICLPLCLAFGCVDQSAESATGLSADQADASAANSEQVATAISRADSDHAVAEQAGASDDTQTAPEPQFGPTGMTSAEMAAVVESSRPIPKVPTDPTSKTIVARLQDRWAALADRDFDAAYSFEAPSYRAEKTAEEFTSAFGPYVTWHGIEPIGIEYVDEATADVSFILDHSITDMQSDKQIRLERYVKERWVQEGGEWWHQSQSVNISGMAQDETGQKP